MRQQIVIQYEAIQLQNNTTNKEKKRRDEPSTSPI